MSSLAKKCDLCGKKLGALETGFWSINAKWLADGVICQHCHDKLQLLAEFRGKWVPRGLGNELPYKALTRKNIVTMELEGARTVMEAPEKIGQGGAGCLR